MSVINEIGHHHGRLTVVGHVVNKGTAASWLCECLCGKRIAVSGVDLRRGHTKSCGCLQRELVQECNTTHGKSNTPTYHVWENMWQRCTNPKGDRYNRYGGRGITVCDDWASFESFIFDMGPRPSDKHSIERLDNDGGYSKRNCIWALAAQQSVNRSNNRFITFQGRTECIAMWAKMTMIPVSTLFARLNSGWSIEEALTTIPGTIPRGQKRPSLTVDWDKEGVFA